MLARNWKHQWLPLCLARWARTIRIGWLVENTMRSNQNLRVFWKPLIYETAYGKFSTKLPWRPYCRKRREFITALQLGTQIFPVPQAMRIPAAKAAVDKEWEKLCKNSAWNLTKVRSNKEVIDEARTKGAKVHFASLMDMCHLKKAELETKH